MKYSNEILDRLSDLVVVIDKDGTIIESNLYAQKIISDYSNGDLAKSIFSIFDDESIAILKEQLQSITDCATCKTKLRSPEATYFQFNINKINSSPYFFIFGRNITEEQKKEIDLLRFSEVIQQTVNPIQITDKNGKIIYVNPAFEKICGYSKDELIGRNPNILNSGKREKSFWKKVWDTVLSGKVWVGQIQNRRKNGELYYTEILISPVVNSEGIVLGYFGAHRDINEQKILEQQLARSQKLETIGTLSAGIAHEVGNPLTSISSIVQVLQRTIHDTFAQEKLELVRTQISRITSIIRQLVDFSRPSNYEIKSVDIHQTLRNALNIVQYGKKISNINFDLKFAQTLPNVPLVADQLIQVFINILMNAVDACDEEPGTIAILTRQIKNQTIEIEFVDTGKGISNEEIKKIFDPFYTTKEVGKGTGLGLWVSLGIVRGFGGDILISSEINNGSTFTVVLPMKGILNVS